MLILGDVDLYVFDSELIFLDENYDVKFFLCGVDIVELFFSMKRFIVVSVFGYFFYSVSKYSLFVFKFSEKEEIDYVILDVLYNDYVDDKLEII